MSRWRPAGLIALCALTHTAAFGAADSGRVQVPERPTLAHTYSIVARDPETGDLGVAVQSHWFSVGPLVAWAEPGVGAVATQSLVEVSYGPLGLERMRAGASAPDALAELLAEDDGREVRQVAMIDAQGRVAAHTGSLCIAEAGHLAGNQFSVQANLMLNDTVWGEMADAYRSAEGDLAARLLAALHAAQEAGGDIRGRQSASLLVVRGEASGEPWNDILFDLRVDDHPEPLRELERLVRLHRAYEMANRGDEHLGKQEFEEAMAAYGKATEYAPDNVELQFWKAASLYKVGRTAEALPIFRRVFEANPDWARVVPRLGGLDVLSGDERFEAAVREILSVAPEEARRQGLSELEARTR